jgi:hypothetical protein
MLTHRTIKRWVDSPILNLLVGVVMFGTGLMEAWATLGDDIATMKLGGHHGIAVFGLFSIIKSLPDLFSGAEYATRRFD